MPRFDQGWVCFYRRCLDSDIGRDAETLAIWVWILGRANWAESSDVRKRGNFVLAPGSLVTGFREIATALKVSKSKVERVLRLLAQTGRIRVESETRGTVISVCNWGTYQSIGDQAGQVRDTNETRSGQDRDCIEQKQGTTRNTRRSRAAYDQAFEGVYSKYPRKEGKAAGHKIYLKLSDEEKRQLPVAVSNYVRRKAGTEVQYLKHFGTFMGEWKDWLDPETGSSTAIAGTPSINVTPLNLEAL